MTDRTQDNGKQDSGKPDDENRPGVTNGIPDDAHKGEAKGLPHSEREATETAGKPDV